MSPLVIASHNEGKVKEFRDLLASHHITVISAATMGLPEPAETGETFAENAVIKSQSAARLSGHFSLADDSGLCVPALDGAPGVYSARWAGPDKDFAVAMERIRTELEATGVNPQGAPAYFICVLALTFPENRTMTFEGRVDGTLSFPPRGKKGFGYDPIFVPQGRSETFAEMDATVKHTFSHRARAFEKFAAHLQGVRVRESV